jgi:hypothetical protein
MPAVAPASTGSATGWFRRRAPGIIEFRDINREPDALSHFGAGLENVHRRLHAVDADGHLMSVLIAPSPFGSLHRAVPGSGGLSACR